MPKHKRTFLDEAYTQPYNSTAPIRIETGTITEDKRSPWRKAQDKFVQWISNPRDPVSALLNIGGKTALAATALANPVETAAFIAGSTAARKAADTTTKKLTGKTTSELLSQSRADLNPKIAEFVNPINVVGGTGGLGVLNLSKSAQNAAINNARQVIANRFNGPAVRLNEDGTVFLTPTTRTTPGTLQTRRNPSVKTQQRLAGNARRALVDMTARPNIENDPLYQDYLGSTEPTLDRAYDNIVRQDLLQREIIGRDYDQLINRLPITEGDPYFYYDGVQDPRRVPLNVPTQIIDDQVNSIFDFVHGIPLHVRNLRRDLKDLDGVLKTMAENARTYNVPETYNYAMSARDEISDYASLLRQPYNYRDASVLNSTRNFLSNARRTANTHTLALMDISSSQQRQNAARLSRELNTPPTYNGEELSTRDARIRSEEPVIEPIRTSKIQPSRITYSKGRRGTSITRGNSTFGANLKGNSMSGIITPYGKIDISGASFFSRDNNNNSSIMDAPNAIMRDIEEYMTPGDIISIASRDGATSINSYPFLQMHLARSINDPTNKGYTIIPTGRIRLNQMGQIKTKNGYRVAERGDSEEVLKDLKRRAKLLQDAYNKKHPDAPIDLSNITFDGNSYYVPGFRAIHLKHGGKINLSNSHRKC